MKKRLASELRRHSDFRKPALTIIVIARLVRIDDRPPLAVKAGRLPTLHVCDQPGLLGVSEGHTGKHKEESDIDFHCLVVGEKLTHLSR